MHFFQMNYMQIPVVFNFSIVFYSYVKWPPDCKMRQEISLHERGTCENPVDSPMELWDGTGHWDLEGWDM